MRSTSSKDRKKIAARRNKENTRGYCIHPDPKQKNENEKDWGAVDPPKVIGPTGTRCSNQSTHHNRLRPLFTPLVFYSDAPDSILKEGKELYAHASLRDELTRPMLNDTTPTWVLIHTHCRFLPKAGNWKKELTIE